MPFCAAGAAVIACALIAARKATPLSIINCDAALGIDAVILAQDKIRAVPRAGILPQAEYAVVFASGRPPMVEVYTGIGLRAPDKVIWR
jgi:hypothetical protein